MAPTATTWILCLLLSATTVGCATSPGRVTVADHAGPGNEPARDPLARSGSVRALVYNVRLLPFPIGNTAIDRPRARRIARAILAEPERHDVVCLTEVFNETLRGELTRALAGAYPYQRVRCEAGLREDSGLCLLSRYPFRREAGRDLCEFLAFPMAWTWTADMLVAKGVLGVALALGEDRDLWLFLTHLQSDPGEAGRFEEVRAEQLGWIRAFMSRCVARSAPGRACAALLVGDLNVVAGSAEYALLFDRIPGVDGSSWTELTRLVVEGCDIRRYRDGGGDYSDHHPISLIAS